MFTLLTGARTVPTYTYTCTSCNDVVEKRQSFTDPPLTTCEQCGGTLRKIIHPVGIVFKGSGWYSTDSRAAAASGSGASSSLKDRGSDSSSKESSTVKESSSKGTSGSRESGSRESGSRDSGSRDSGSRDSG